VTFDRLRSRMRAARTCGVFHVELRGRGALGAGLDDRAACDALVSALGFRTLGDEWHELRRAEARLVIREILWHDLAYGSRIMEGAAAAGFADEFLAFFEPDARFFTSAAFHEHQIFVDLYGIATSYPLTEATFDTGVVAVDRRSVGIVWAEDED
jgi:hypothetical protein